MGKNDIRAKRAIILFFLFILISLLILLLAISTCKIGIEVINLIIDTDKPKGEKINKDSELYLFITIFKKIKIVKIQLNETKLRKRDLDIKFIKNKDIKIDYNYLLKNIEIEQINLHAQVGTEDSALTAILTGIISTVLGIMLKKPKYEIIPIFANKNFLKIKLDCIISVDLMQYIYKLLTNKVKDLGNSCLNKKVEV